MANQLPKGVSDVREKLTGEVFATVKGNVLQNHARRLGVRIGPSRFWFIGDNWTDFLAIAAA